MSQENITKKLDINNDSKISTEELKKNISRFDTNDWYFLEGELEKKNNAVVNLIEKPLLDLIKKNDLFEKYNVTVDELKIMKLACLCYKINPNKWTGTSLAGYAMYASTYKYGGNIWKYYKEEILPVKGIASTGRTDEGWLSMEGVNGIQQAVAPKAPPVVKKTPTRKQAPGFVQENMTPGERVIESIYEIEGDVTEESLRELKIDESDIKYSLNKIVSRAKGAYFSEFEDCRMEAAEEYKRNGGDIDMTSYINYKLYMFAFSKYCENINNKHKQLVNDAGYNGDDEFCEQVKLFEQFQEQMGKKYPNLGETMESFKKYSSEIEKVKNKYFGGKSENDIKEAEGNYMEFQTFEKNKSKEYGITQELLASVNSVPQTSEESQEYFQNLNKVLAYQSELDQEKSKYNGSIEKYHNYITGMKGVQDKYKNINFDIIKEYNSDMAERKTKGLDFDKYGKYTSLLSNNKYVITGLKNIELINGVLNDPLNEQFPISAITKLEKEKIVKQEKTDKRWNRIKENMPVIYQITNSLVGFWNGFIDATIGVGTSLGAMLLGAAKGKDNYEHQLKRKEKRDNFFKINQSTSQKQAVYDPETGSLNFNLDNTVATVSGGVAQMICLIYGGGAIGKGISKAGTKVGVKLGEKAVGKAGLFSSAFITEVGHSYTEAIHSGLDGAGAFGYSMFAASIQGGLELISPNEVLLGKGLGLGKELISNICKNGNREGLKLVGKYFLKTTGREILEENLQEGIQLAAGNLVNDMINGVWNTGLESDWNPKNFLSTAIITTLTTGVTTGFSASRQGVQILNSNQPQLIEWIKSDEGLYEDVIKVIDDTISGRFQIPNVDVNLLQELKTTLVDIHTNPSLIQEGAQPQNNENNEVEKKIDYFDGKSHKYEVTETQAIGNSEMMDNILNEINKEGISQEEISSKLQELKKIISEQYKEATGQELELTDEQLLSILDAHEQDGVLGELTLGQLKKKVKILSETIKDKNVRRFLLEAGFCGKLFEKVKSNLTKNLDYSESGKYMEKKVDRIIPQSYFTDLDFVFRAGRTEFLIEQTGNENYRVINLTDYQTYELGSGSESVIGREGDITIQSDDYASRQHLTLKIDADGNIIIRDTSTNGTLYLFTDKLSGTQYVQESKNLAQEIRTEDVNQQVVETEIGIRNITNDDLSILDSLNKGNKEEIYLNEYGLPKNVISLGNGNKLYVTNCLAYGGRNHIVGYVNEGGKMKLRLFYRSNSEGARRACPGKVTGRNASGEIATGYSKGEEIENSSYETTTRVTPEIQNIFDELPQETSRSNPITLEGMDPKLQKKIGDTILEKEMANNVKITKLFEGYPNDTVEVVMNNNSQDIKRMYENLGQEFYLSGMKIVEGEGYTYLHPFLGNIDVTVCSVNINGSELYFSFSRATNDPQNRVRIEEVRYADAELTSFGIYNKQINAAPLTGKPIDYDNQVPIDMRNNEKIGGTYIDIRTLYQRNPFILKFKDISGTKNIPEQSNYDNPSNEEIVVNGNDQYIENGYKIGDEVNIPRSDGRITKATITAYNPQTGEYRVEWTENGKQWHKDLQKEDLDSVNNEEIVVNGNDQYIENGYQIGEEVNIPRSDGRVTKATITAYNPQTGEYRVEWIENGNQWHKDLQKWQLDSVNNSNEERYVVDYDETDTSEEQNRERPDRGINTERKERSDVQRNSDVIAIGDLHGEYAAFKGNMEFAGLAKEVNGHLEWIGGDKKVVFQGDILADRGTDGLRIIEEIHRLREQAREQGGDIDIIIGNHDDFMISFLTQRNGAHGNGIEAANHPLAPTQGLGLTELAKFIGGETGDFDIIRGQQDIILNEMRKSPEGRIILEEICNMKLISQVDDVLYCHTNPTEAMVQYLTNGNVQNNINYVNHVFQGYLRSNLLLEGESPISKKEFNKISDLFLDTGNRDIGGVEKYSDILRNAGINVICHGHSGGDGRRYGNKNIYTNNKVDVGVEIIDTDNSYGKGGHTNGPHSVCIVKQDGGQTLVGEEAAY